MGISSSSQTPVIWADSIRESSFLKTQGDKRGRESLHKKSFTFRKQKLMEIYSKNLGKYLNNGLDIRVRVSALRRGLGIVNNVLLLLLLLLLL